MSENADTVAAEGGATEAQALADMAEGVGVNATELEGGVAGEVSAEHPDTIALAVIAQLLRDKDLVDAEADFDIAEATGAALHKLTERGDLLELELAEAIEQRDKALAELAKAAGKASASRGAKAPKARKIGPDQVKLELPGGDDERKTALLEAILAAETVEIAFSNGKTEVLDIEPVRISGPAWRSGVVGVQLTLPELLIHGPQQGRPAFEVRGYGLYLDGELAAYGDRGGLLTIAPGARQNIAPDIVF